MPKAIESNRNPALAIYSIYAHHTHTNINVHTYTYAHNIWILIHHINVWFTRKMPICSLTAHSLFKQNQHTFENRSKANQIKPNQTKPNNIRTRAGDEETGLKELKWKFQRFHIYMFAFVKMPLCLNEEGLLDYRLDCRRKTFVIDHSVIWYAPLITIFCLRLVWHCITWNSK